MFRDVLSDKYFIRVVIAGILFELVTVTIMFMTMGHAGPEGPVGIFGWIALALNMPGLAISSLWADRSDSILVVAVKVLIAQFLLICAVAFLVRAWMLRAKHR